MLSFIKKKILPKGVILFWSGTVASIPSGFALCNGSNGTPDLRDKFIVGAYQDDSGVAKSYIEGTLKQTGGNTSHAHPLSTTQVQEGTGAPKMCLSSSTTISQNHIPSFYALAMIMKL